MNMFDETVALEGLKEDRKQYIEKILKTVKGWLDVDNNELAAHTLIEAGRNLALLDGAIQYVKELYFFKTNEYPRFNTLFGG